MGGMNYHIDIPFEDGVMWIARVRRFNATSPPPTVRDYILKSEVATLKFLEGTDVPAPKMFDHALEQDGSGVGVGYILTEKLPGKALRWPGATAEQRRRVMDQLADVFLDLYRHPFNALGSLGDGESHPVCAIAQEPMMDLVDDGLRLSGPFHSWSVHRRSLLEQELARITAGETHSQRALDAYLIHRFLLDLVDRLKPASNPSGKFYLKHGDDKGDHILVDENFNITGIIDWEWAYTADPADAFNSPIGLLPVADFYAGNGSIGDDEAVFAELFRDKGQPQLAQFVLEGRVRHLYSFCCGHNPDDWDGFLSLFRGLREAVGVDENLDWAAWKDKTLNRYREDAGLQVVLTRCESGNGGGSEY